MEVAVTKESDGSLLGSGSSVGSGSTAVAVDAPYTPSPADVSALDDGTNVIVTIIVKALIGGILKSLFSRKKVTIGISTLCYEVSGQSVENGFVFCDYRQITPCPVNCASQLMTDRAGATELANSFTCTYRYLSRDVAWVKKDSKVAACKKNFFPTLSNSACVCKNK
jgi:hypothetical protein